MAAFFGDISGDEAYTTQDVTLEQRVIGLANSGFGFFKMTDPTLLGDITGNGVIQANDTTLIQRVIGQISVPNIPPLPTGVTPPPSNGPDPKLFIPNVSGQAGQVVTVPVDLTVTEPAGITISSFQVAIAYDPSKFTVSSTAQIGSTFAALGNPVVFFPAAGEIIVEGSSAAGTGTIPYNTTADLFDLTFTVAAGAANGTTVINLLQNIQTTDTAIFANDANLTQLTLTPAPTNSPNDPVDGIFGIGTAVLASIAVTPAAPSVALGVTEQFVAMGTYSDGTTEDLSSQVTWVSATTSVASISDTGLATTLSTGSTDITATLGNVTSPVDTLTVTAAALSSIAVDAGLTERCQGPDRAIHGDGNVYRRNDRGPYGPGGLGIGDAVCRLRSATRAWRRLWR